MAVPVGFLPVMVVSWADRENDEGASLPDRVPDPDGPAARVAVPSPSALVSWAASATAQRLRPVRISTATFE